MDDFIKIKTKSATQFVVDVAAAVVVNNYAIHTIAIMVVVVVVVVAVINYDFANTFAITACVIIILLLIILILYLLLLLLLLGILHIIFTINKPVVNVVDAHNITFTFVVTTNIVVVNFDTAVAYVLLLFLLLMMQ